MVPWRFYIAKKLGYYSGWKYWAIRAAVIIGGAAIGWFAAKLLTKILQGFLDTHKAIYNKLPRLAKKFLGLKCFVAGTLVLTPDGYRKIEEIEVGDTVLTYDFIHCRVVESNVLETYVSDAETLIHVFSGETEIVSSSGHRYYTSNRGWVQAQNLNKNDELLTEDGSICFVSDVIVEKKDCPVRVYNLNVGTHQTADIINFNIRDFFVQFHPYGDNRAAGIPFTKHCITVNPKACRITRILHTGLIRNKPEPCIRNIFHILQRSFKRNNVFIGHMSFRQRYGIT